MGKTLDFNKARRKRRMVQNAKRLLVLLVIIGAVGGIVMLNSLLVEKGLSVKVSDIIESMGGDGFPTEAPGGIVRDMRGMGNDLLLLNDTNLIMYNRKAKIVTNIQRMSENTVITSNSSRVLTYDIGGKSYRIHTPSQQYEMETENSIISADMGDNDTFALVTTSRQRVAEVLVYKNHGEPHIFLWASPEDHLTNVSLSPKCNLIAVSSIATESGILKSSINIFNLGVAKPLAVTDFIDSLILEVDFYNQDRIAVLTDNEYCVLNSDGGKIGSHAISDTVTAFDRFEKYAVLLTENRESRLWNCALIQEDGIAASRYSSSVRVRDVEIDGKRIYLLTDSGISVFDHDFVLEYSISQRNISRMEQVAGRLYYCTDEEIRILEKPETKRTDAN